MNPTEVVETMSTSAKTNELLAQLSEDNKSLRSDMTALRVQHRNDMNTVIQQNQTLQSEVLEMKDIMRDIQTNPQLIVLCDKLYPLDALREIDLKTCNVGHFGHF